MTTHLESELQLLKTDTLNMWKLVCLQLTNGKEALVNFDKDLARQIVATEKRVNAYELKIDRDCENIFALFNPVAIDLRFVLAVLKINSNLERIADIAESIARFVIDIEKSFDPELLQSTKVIEMFDLSNEMLLDAAHAFEKEDTKMARYLFKIDEKLDETNNNASYVVTDYIRSHPNNIRESLHILSMMRKLERVGDQTKNIAEEIIFFIEAKVLKHKGGKQ
ncbi:MAG: phosphate signaling complex protein PhoU [Bacteroidetes bacterium]|nr:phosphate signaling complex protein PhoU [Bacteroidota bacterium]